MNFYWVEIDIFCHRQMSEEDVEKTEKEGQKTPTTKEDPAAKKPAS